jgi:hypothetical protein
VSTSRTKLILSAIAASALVAAACGDDTASSGHSSTTAAAPAATARWRDEVAGKCAGGVKTFGAIPDSDGTPAGIAAQATALKAAIEGAPDYGSIAVPADVQPTLDRVLDMGKKSVGLLDASIAAANAGDAVAAQRAFDEGNDYLSRFATAWAMAGARCGPADPARIRNADLTIPLEMQPEQATAAFGSIWVSENLADRVLRLDPDTGKVQATIEVGHSPFRMQPANGSMWVRTDATYDEIDPHTNTVTRRLAKADVGPAANRSFAVDGAMWICDGRRLHRYDPRTLTPVATLDVGVDCNTLWADDHLVVAWNWDEDPSESGRSAVAFIDPNSNKLLATVPLPFDVGGPVVLPDAVFFPGYGGSKAAVVDRGTWTVKATPDIGVSAGGNGQPAFDGESIYVGTSNHTDVARIDSKTFTVSDIIPALEVNAVLLDGDSLWIAGAQPADAVQRFDLDERR